MALVGGTAAAALAAATVVLAVFVVWPLGAVLVVATSAPVTGAPASVVGSLALAVASTVATLAVAAPLAYAVVRGGAVARRPIAAAACLPLLAPPFTAGLALLVLLGPRAQAAWALVAAQALTFVPHACVLLAAGLGALERDREEAAESLGAGAWTVFTRVTLPRAWPALRSAALTTFLASLADLGNPVLVGREHPVVTRDVYARAVSAGDPAAAGALAVALAIPYVAAWSLGRGRGIPATRTPAAPGRAAPDRRRSAPGPRRWRGGAAAAIAAVLAAPWLVVVTASLVRGDGDWSPSLVHWAAVVGSAGGRAIGWSVALALLAGAAGSAGTLAVAYLLERVRRRGTGALGALARLPGAVPGVVLGLGYLLALGGPPDVAALAFLASAASVVFWRLPGALDVASEALRRLDPATESAALGLGAPAGRTLVRVVLPALAPAAAATFAIFFVSGLATVATVAFLAGPSFPAAAPTALARAAGGAVGEASALVTLVLGLAWLAALALRARPGRAWMAALLP